MNITNMLNKEIIVYEARATRIIKIGKKKTAVSFGFFHKIKSLTFILPSLIRLLKKKSKNDKNCTFRTNFHSVN